MKVDSSVARSGRAGRGMGGEGESRVGWGGPAWGPDGKERRGAERGHSGVERTRGSSLAPKAAPTRVPPPAPDPSPSGAATPCLVAQPRHPPSPLPHRHPHPPHHLPPLPHPPTPPSSVAPAPPSLPAPPRWPPGRCSQPCASPWLQAGQGGAMWGKAGQSSTCGSELGGAQQQARRAPQQPQPAGPPPLALPTTPHHTPLPPLRGPAPPRLPSCACARHVHASTAGASPARCSGVTAMRAMIVEQLGLAMMPPLPHFMPDIAW